MAGTLPRAWYVSLRLQMTRRITSVIIITILAFPADWVAVGISALRVGPATVTTFEGASQ